DVLDGAVVHREELDLILHVRRLREIPRRQRASRRVVVRGAERTILASARDVRVALLVVVVVILEIAGVFTLLGRLGIRLEERDPAKALVRLEPHENGRALAILFRTHGADFHPTGAPGLA